MSLRLAIWLYFGLTVLDIKSLNTNKSRWSLSSLISEIFTSSEVLLNVSACIFCDIPTLLRRMELHRQLTHQPDCDRIFWKLLSSTFSFAVTVMLSSDLQMPVTANFCVSSTTYLSRLTSTIYKRTRQFLTQVMQVHFSWHPGGVLPYLGYTGTCRWIGYGFLASLSKTGYTIWLASVLDRLKCLWSKK